VCHIVEIELADVMLQKLIEMNFHDASNAGRIQDCDAWKCLVCDAITWLDKLD
jgi:hypothetical protein